LEDVSAQVVVEASGLFISREAASKHLHGTAKKVIMTQHPAKG